MGRYTDTKQTHNKHAGRRHAKARRHLIRKYGHCAITGYTNPVEYQSAHIIPRSVGYEIQFDRVDSPSNCILLANGLHALFDNFSWTVDIYSFLDYGVQSEAHFTVTLAIKKLPLPGSSSICDYIDKKITLPIEYLPSFYVHYNVYMCHNYTVHDGSISQLFKHYLDTEEYIAIKDFQYTSEFRDYFISKRSNKNVIRSILGHTKKDYHVLWQYWSFSYTTHEYKENVDRELTEAYDTYLEHLDDPNWVPTQ